MALRDTLIETLMAEPDQSPVWLALGGFKGSYASKRRKHATAIVDTILTALAEEEPDEAMISAGHHVLYDSDLSPTPGEEAYAIDTWKAMMTAALATPEIESEDV